MRKFMDEDFLLSTPAAQKLYHDYAENMPIYDYHCHLSPKEIAENIRFRNIGHLMLGGDHYKWRAMAAYGIDDRNIRGEGSDYDKFLAYATAMPYMIGNPLYHWTHLELKRVFGIETPLNAKSAPEIWEKANAMLATDDFRAKRLIEKFNVKLVCTTDDPVDSLEWHDKIAEDKEFKAKVLPAFRPDKAVNILKGGFADYIAQLSKVSGIEIKTTADVIAALDSRVEYFHQHGARISDHGLDTLPAPGADMARADAALAAALSGKEVCPECADHYRACLLIALGGMYARRGWVQQYHVNALRNNNSAMFDKYGPDTGFDSVNDSLIAEKLSFLMDAQEKLGMLPKTILYSLNERDNYVLASMAGNYQTNGKIAGRIQFGSAWWFCDQKDGMFTQMRNLASVGLLSKFVGMLTDSRSFVSYPRHEYFRRILCELIGSWVDNGEYPEDWDTLGEIVRGVCYNNAVEYFGIDL